MVHVDFVNEDRFDEMEELSRSLFGKEWDEDVCIHMREDCVCLNGASSTGRCKKHCSYFDSIKE